MHLISITTERGTFDDDEESGAVPWRSASSGGGQREERQCNSVRCIRKEQETAHRRRRKKERKARDEEITRSLRFVLLAIASWESLGVKTRWDRITESLPADFAFRAR